MVSPWLKHRFPCFLVPLIFLLASSLAFTAKKMPAEKPIPLWPAGVGGNPAATGPEADITTAKERATGGKPVIRLGNIKDPSLTLYPAPASSNTGAAVLVFPGGGYHILAWDLEGTEVCQWLNSIGVNAVLVKYRVPEPENLSRYALPLQDAQRAISLVRSHAQQWHLDPGRIGVLGFSAGGHLAALLSNHYEKPSYPSIADDPHVSMRPDFVILIYPAYLSVRDEGQELAPEVNVTPHAPPTFIVQAEDDHTFVEGTLLYYRALKRANIPAEMHLYPKGGHGYGLRPTADRVTGWPTLAADWLRSLGVLHAAATTARR